MTFDAIDAWWWPFLFILVAGWLATDIWRWIGVFLGNKIDETAELLVYVRAVATALVAAVIAQLILFPSGALAETAIGLRILATVIGFALYLYFSSRIAVGVFSSLMVLTIGMLMGY
ncbi:MAG: AzlD domain-containing protein [Ahrensia sp.]|nr:AzlD domain-containing protein [Ahrensia sp.]